MSWLAIIGGFIQLVLLVLSKKFEKDTAEKERKKVLSDDLKSAIDSGDIPRINVIIERIRLRR